MASVMVVVIYQKLAFLSCALSSIAAAKGHVEVAEAVLELTPPHATDFLTWLHER
jgi:hypothetical protein